MYPFPHFLMIGAAKSGTTSIHEYLRQHPKITLPIQKETHFFIFDQQGIAPEPNYMGREFNSVVNNWEAYKESFEKKDTAEFFGEVCPSYLFFPNASQNINDHVPDVKIFAILRNPIDRFLSNLKYYQVRHDDITLSDFASVVEESKENIHLLRLLSYGNYYSHLMRYYEKFPEENINVFLYEDFQRSPQKVLEQILNSMDLPSFQFNVNQRFNITGEPRFPLIYKFIIRNRVTKPIRKILPVKSYQKLRSSAEEFFFKKRELPTIKDKSVLIDYYRNELESLAKLIHRDLSEWMK